MFAPGFFQGPARDGNPLNNCDCNLEVVTVPVADQDAAYSESMYGHVVSDRDESVFLCDYIASMMTGAPLELFLPPFPATNPPDLGEGEPSAN